MDPTQQTASTPVSTQEDPGKQLGIVGLIFTFTGLQLIGLIISIVAFKKSKKAGFTNKLARLGIILNSIIVGLVVILVPILVSITILSYSGITEKAFNQSSKAASTTVVRASEIYAASTGTYPTTVSQIEAGIQSVHIATSPITSQPKEADTVAFYTCGTDGNKIESWDYIQKTTVTEFSGNATTSSNCVLVTN